MEGLEMQQLGVGVSEKYLVIREYDNNQLVRESR